MRENSLQLGIIFASDNNQISEVFLELNHGGKFIEMTASIL